jgi:hypothetical protein
LGTVAEQTGPPVSWLPVPDLMGSEIILGWDPDTLLKLASGSPDPKRTFCLIENPYIFRITDLNNYVFNFKLKISGLNLNLGQMKVKLGV